MSNKKPDVKYPEHLVGKLENHVTPLEDKSSHTDEILNQEGNEVQLVDEKA